MEDFEKKNKKIEWTEDEDKIIIENYV